MPGPRTSKEVSDYMLIGLDRAGIWSYLWRLYANGASRVSIKAGVRRWERLTGRKYNGR